MHRALAVVLLASGCDRFCVGNATDPSCEAQWSTTRLVGHQGERWRRERGPWTDASWTFDRGEDEGVHWQLASEQNWLIIGQPEADRVVLHEIDSGGPTGSVPRVFTGAGSFGSAIATGDVDGDGSWDLWVGAQDTSLGRGSAYLFLDAETTPRDQEEADLQIRSWTPGDHLGRDVLACGDVTGDGVGDWLVTAPGFSRPSGGAMAVEEVPDLAGAVFVLRSERLADARGAALPSELGSVWWGAEVGAGFGVAAVCDADLDADGLADIAVGAPWTGSASGAFTVVAGGDLPALGPADTSLGRLVFGAEETWLGASLATGRFGLSAGEDLLVGLPGDDGGRGRAVLYAGQELLGSGTTPSPRASFAGNPTRDPGDHVGRVLATGDIDGDGLDDVLVGAPDRKSGRRPDAGQVSLWLGLFRDDWRTGEIAGIGDVGTADVALTGDRPFQHVGLDMLVADIDGDGVDDLVLPTRKRPEQ